MGIQDWYTENFESGLSGRYVNLNAILPLINNYKSSFEITVPGTSELKKDIPMLKIGNGKKVILAWSQMHGNESTTTKAIFDFLKFIAQKRIFQSEIEKFKKDTTFYIIPMLNPDGAEIYTRENSNNVDLNRDADNLTQSESRVLRQVFDSVKPDLCLNLHDQRSIFGLDTGLPATVSFLSPSADAERSVTAARKTAMELIVKMNKTLQKLIPGQIGRFDDSFNINCVGDKFQQIGIPTILFEAGHIKLDYEREQTRELIFYALLSLFGIIDKEFEGTYKEYFNIPENRKNFKDIIVRNVSIGGTNKPVSVAIQYSEQLKSGKIVFLPMIDAFGDLKDFYSHREIVEKSMVVLTDSQNKLTVGTKVSQIFNKSKDLAIIFQ